jgi:hypothetical protein
MTLGGADPLDALEQSLWRDETEKFLDRTITEMLEAEGEVREVDVSIDLTAQTPPLERKRGLRSLQQTQSSGLELTFTAVINILSSIEEHDVNEYILAAFETEQDAYIALLKATGDPAFAEITSVTVSPAKNVVIEVATPEDTGENGGMDIAMIGIIVGAAVAGLAGIGLLAFFFHTRRRNKFKKDTLQTSPTSPSLNEHGSGPYGEEIEVGDRDDISTLGDPIPPHLRHEYTADDPTAFNSTGDSLTADYDFQKAYRSGQVSMMDTNTESDPSTFVSKDDVTLEAEYTCKSNQFQVEAPPGLLGLVLETSEEGVPVVHAIKKTSCLALEVQVGDYLVAVDGEDVTTMLSSSVSRLIASKKDNAVRRFVFTRPDEN